VPFSDRGGVVTVSLEERSDRHAVVFDQSRTETTEHAALQSRAPGIAAGEHAVTRGRANGGSAVGVGENHAFPCRAIEIRRGDLAGGIQARDIAVTKIIAQDVDDVGAVGGGGADDERDEQEQEETGHQVKLKV
jgi:hypothetical protein